MHFSLGDSTQIEWAAAMQGYQPQLLLWRREPPEGGDPVVAEALAAAARRQAEEENAANAQAGACLRPAARWRQ